MKSPCVIRKVALSDIRGRRGEPLSVELARKNCRWATQDSEVRVQKIIKRIVAGDMVNLRVVLGKNNRLIAGKHRALAALMLGWTEINAEIRS